MRAGGRFSGGRFAGGRFAGGRFSGRGGFDIASLFANGEAGAWYDPSDLTTLFQDSAGTTPVTADGDPVGLMLDKSQGLELGPELVTNGTFDDGLTGYIQVGTPTVVDGQLVAERLGGNDEGVDQEIILEAGKTYLGTVDVLSGSAWIFGFRSSGGAFITGGSTTNNERIIFTPSTTGTYRIRALAAVDDNTVVFDNISVRELPGNHATQPTSSARPVYRTDGTLHWLEFDGVDDVLVSSSVPMIKPFLMATAVEIEGTPADEQIGIASSRATAADETNTLSIGGGGYRTRFWHRSSSSLNAPAAPASDLLDNNAHVLLGWMSDATTQNLEIDGGAKITATENPFAGSADDRISVGGIVDSSPQFGRGKVFQGIVVITEVTASQRDNIRNYLANKSGVTL